MKSWQLAKRQLAKVYSCLISPNPRLPDFSRKRQHVNTLFFRAPKKLQCKIKNWSVDSFIYLCNTLVSENQYLKDSLRKH
jgi:hypothetical protein